MKAKDKQAWREKNLLLNTGYNLKVGDRVIDEDGNKGVVVKITEGISVEDHGCVWVWQEDRYEYGADNCEHYCHINWHAYLRLL
jgi:hypothetical protein